MKPLRQTKGLIENERGNCLATCVASIFEDSIESTPQFEELPPGTWRNALAQWAKRKGYLVTYADPDTEITGYHIMVGLTRGKTRHAVIGHCGQIVHDPSEWAEDSTLEPVEYYICFDQLRENTKNNNKNWEPQL